MTSNLFAFNVAQPIPEAEIAQVGGAYDPQQQLWVGLTESGLCSSFYCGTSYCSCASCAITDSKTDGDCD